MLTRADLRTVPAAAVLWTLAVLGIACGIRAALLLLLALAALALCGAACLRRPGAITAVGAHLVLIGLGAALLLPGVYRHETTVLALEDASATGRIVELEAVATGDSQESSSTLPGAEDRRQVMVRLRPGPARIGSEEAALSASTRMLVTGGKELLDPVHDHDVIRVRARVAQTDGIVILAAARVDVLEAAHGPGQHVRETARDLTASLPDDEAALSRGMTTGDTSGMSTETEEIMRRAGISHLVAVSGANIALVLGAVLVPALLLGVPRRPRVAAAAVAGAAYVALVGDEPSVLRAATMAAPILAARFMGVRASPVAALGAAIALWSCLDPATAASAGFLLSALATAAILVLAPAMANAAVSISGERIPRTWALLLAVPLAAQLACTPVLVLLTPEVSVWAVPVNMAVAPIVGPATIIGMIATLIGPAAPALATPLWQLTAGGAHLVILVARTADSLPGSRIAVPDGAWGAVLALLAIALVVAGVLGHRSRIVRFVLAAVLVGVLAPPLAQRLPVPGVGADDWRVAACAVGQGDAVLLRERSEDADVALGSPGDGEPATVLVDTGPDPDALRSCLDRLHVTRIDLLVLTHPHADHVGGIDALTGERTPTAQWVCPLPEALSKTVPDVPVTPVAAGMTETEGSLGLDVLWPASADDARQASHLETGGEGDDFNDCSVVVRATWPDGVSYVGLGDLEPVGQARLLAARPGPATIVKTAHHGSKRQTAGLYDALSPQVMLFTVGKDNTFGHPSPQTLSIAERLGARSARTDVDGTVLLPVDDPLSPRGVGPAG
ncbi:ComEC/Rec2 family competence protein [Brachybacterium sp. ACRRE]|uniref:ComEC/Rec2 family competence protein n=1 Tax=Brachybacterium sp. ACRRE TaxID=2918184 RepID=UPI001EF20678|nr:ComEC/Rec2 family competence protein [Brachybacterium sp. ACRRE]